jgi:hypothetical protein
MFFVFQFKFRMRKDFQPVVEDLNPSLTIAGIDLGWHGLEEPQMDLHHSRPQLGAFCFFP